MVHVISFVSIYERQKLDRLIGIEVTTSTTGFGKQGLGNKLFQSTFNSPNPQHLQHTPTEAMLPIFIRLIIPHFSITQALL